VRPTGSAARCACRSRASDPCQMREQTDPRSDREPAAATLEATPSTWIQRSWSC
jgi:hypothetical protein